VGSDIFRFRATLLIICVYCSILCKVCQVFVNVCASSFFFALYVLAFYHTAYLFVCGNSCSQCVLRAVLHAVVFLLPFSLPFSFLCTFDYIDNFTFLYHLANSIAETKYLSSACGILHIHMPKTLCSIYILWIV
jgi:hypothetical protein